jgi:hypothetical protein
MSHNMTCVSLISHQIAAAGGPVCAAELGWCAAAWIQAIAVVAAAPSVAAAAAVVAHPCSSKVT